MAYEKCFTWRTYITLLIYLDGIVVLYGKSFEAQLLNLEEALQHLSDANLNKARRRRYFSDYRFLSLDALFLNLGSA